MRGHVRKVGKRWQYVVDLGEHPARRCVECNRRHWADALKADAACTRCGGALGPVEDERRQEFKGRFELQRDAEAALNVALGRIGDKTHVLPSKTTVTELFDVWIVHARFASPKGELKATTLDDYTRRFRRDIEPRLGRYRVQTITGPRISQFVGELRATGGRDSNGLSASSVHHAFVILGAMLDYAVESNLIALNPARKVRPPAVGRQRVVGMWSSDELMRFLHAIADDRDYPLFRLMVVSGCRRGEALGATWDALDLDTGTWAITQSLTVLNGRPVVQSPKTADGTRTVRLDAETVAVLRAWRKRQMEERLAAETWTDEGWVFTTPTGNHRHPNLVSRRFLRLAAQAGLKRITVHGIRHSAIIHMLRNGIDLKSISGRVGHSSVRITLDLYGHVLDDMAQDAADKIASAFPSLHGVAIPAR